MDLFPEVDIRYLPRDRVHECLEVLLVVILGGKKVSNVSCYNVAADWWNLLSCVEKARLWDKIWAYSRVAFEVRVGTSVMALTKDVSTNEFRCCYGFAVDKTLCMHEVLSVHRMCMELWFERMMKDGYFECGGMIRRDVQARRLLRLSRFEDPYAESGVPYLCMYSTKAGGARLYSGTQVKEDMEVWKAGDDMESEGLRSGAVRGVAVAALSSDGTLEVDVVERTEGSEYIFDATWVALELGEGIMRGGEGIEEDWYFINLVGDD